MIPIRLRLRNFLSYGDNVPPLSFDGIHVACLCGENGHGKSALLDAITWAIWGRARTSDRRDVSEDELIQLGKSEMEVEFEFWLDGNRYLVLRKRSVRVTPRRRSGSTVLEFMVANGGTDGDGEVRYRPLTGDTLHATQRKINDVLRMDYESFINSAFILQGRADEFTRKTPSERKQVLCDLLGLSLYDRLEERARENARRAESERRELESAMAEIDGELSHESGYRSELEQVLKRIAEMGETIRVREREVATLREGRQALESKGRERAELLARVAREDQALGELRAQIGRHHRQLAEQEEVVSRGEAIRAGYEELVSARSQVDEMNARLAALLEISEQKSRSERAVADARNHLVADLRVLTAEIASLQKQCESAPAQLREKSECERLLAGLAQLEGERDSRREMIQTCKGQVELLRVTNARVVEDGKQIREKLDLLAQAGATCPICASELDAAGRARLRLRFEEQVRVMTEEFRTNKAKIKDLEGEIEVAQCRLATVEKLIQQRSTLERRLAMADRALAEAHEAESRLSMARTADGDLSRRIDGNLYAASEQESLRVLAARIARLGYDGERHKALKDRCARLAGHEELKARLDVAEKRVPEERAALEKLGQMEAERRAVLSADRERASALEVELARLTVVLRELRQVEAGLDELMSQQHRAQQEHGRARQLLNHCEYLRGQRSAKLAAQSRAVEEKSVYDELATAFGKKGIQAMIIEGAIPEIEQEANALLARMTDNRLHISFETQRDARSGDGVIETLDIKIADEMGLRNLELYSGGEAFRVNFAVRIALSKLLAHRAGARLQTLVIDEGFGTQDSLGRQRLVEAISSISNDFEKIIVVTHIEELKDAFPTRIDVVKGPEGSQVSVH